MFWSTLCTWIDACYYKATFSFSFCFFLPHSFLFLLVSFSRSPFLLTSFSNFCPIFFFFSVSWFSSFFSLFLFPFLSSYASFCLSFTIFILSFSVIQKPPEDIWRKGASFLFVNKDNLIWMHCISLAVFLPPDALFTASDASKAREYPFNTHQEKIFLGQLRDRPGTSGAQLWISAGMWRRDLTLPNYECEYEG